MKKRILFMILTAIFCLTLMPFGVGAANDTVAVTGGVMIVNYDLNVSNGTSVMLVVLPKKVVEGEDVTASLLPNAVSLTTEILQTANVEYLVTLKVEDGNISHVAKMKDSLGTGLCCVYINYYGSNGWVKIKEFEHVGVDDIRELLAGFNEGTAATYGTVISTDLSGKNVLKKSSADLSFYEGLTLDTDKTAYLTVLEKLRPVSGNVVQDFDILTLVAALSESVAWTKLQLEADTETVLKTYNETYWNLPLSSTDDFYSLSGTEKTKLLTKMKTGGYTKASSLEADFHDGLVMGLFHDVENWEELQALISVSSTYADDFAGIRDILSGANLSEGDYKTVSVLNSVLPKRSTCTTMEQVEALVRASLPSEEGGDDDDDSDNSSVSLGGGRGNGGGGGGISVAPKEEKPVETPSAAPFSDVPSEHWAASYIERLYKSGAINGVSATQFAPGASVTRQDFVKILVGAIGAKMSQSQSVFSDLSSGGYYEPYIMTAYENGFISGTGNGHFGMGANMTREDVAVVIGRIVEKYNLSASGEEKAFADISHAADYAKDAILLASKAGIFSGDEKGCFNPKAELSRSEACAILCRLADLIKGE